MGNTFLKLNNKHACPYCFHGCFCVWFYCYGGYCICIGFVNTCVLVCCCIGGLSLACTVSVYRCNDDYFGWVCIPHCVCCSFLISSDTTSLSSVMLRLLILTNQTGSLRLITCPRSTLHWKRNVDNALFCHQMLAIYLDIKALCECSNFTQSMKQLIQLSIVSSLLIYLRFSDWYRQCSESVNEASQIQKQNKIINRSIMIKSKQTQVILKTFPVK